MTFGQLFTTMNPNVTVRENGTCVWLYFDNVNYYTIGTEWWDKEIPDNAIVALLKEQEPIKPKTGKWISQVRAVKRCKEAMWDDK